MADRGNVRRRLLSLTPEKAVYREQVKLNARLREIGSRLALKLKRGGLALMLDKRGRKRIMEILEADVNE